MYKNVKYILKKLLPKNFLFKIELPLRSLWYQFYRGHKYHCNICNKGLRKFMELNGQDKLCPNCGSLARDRRLWQLLDENYLKNGITVLDFSPSRNLFRKLMKKNQIIYLSTDLSSNFIAEYHFDITNIKLHDASCDLIICYHILEHIENDIQAINELYRVIKSNGTCIIQTPFTNGKIYEDYSIKSEVDRAKHFGQFDHVRIYSVTTLKDRLESCGFKVSIKEFNENANNQVGFKECETVLICTT